VPFCCCISIRKTSLEAASLAECRQVQAVGAQSAAQIERANALTQAVVSAHVCRSEQPYRYGSPEQLIADLGERVIGPAEAKAKELRTIAH
jgi:hypothetical protein